eukprot:3902259-Rhodomonas_salina.5
MLSEDSQQEATHVSSVPETSVNDEPPEPIKRSKSSIADRISAYLEAADSINRPSPERVVEPPKVGRLVEEPAAKRDSIKPDSEKPKAIHLCDTCCGFLNFARDFAFLQLLLTRSWLPAGNRRWRWWVDHRRDSTGGMGSKDRRI